MKKYVLIAVLFLSQTALAAQCRIDIKNEVHLNQESVDIQQENGNTAVLQKNAIQVAGQWLSLNADQQAALNHYLDGVQTYLPKAQRLAQDGLAFADSVIDDVAESLGAPDALGNMKASVHSLWDEIQSRYYKDGDFILPADTFEQMSTEWAQHAERLQQIFNDEFATSAWNVMSAKMNEDGGLNLTELANNMTTLKANITEKFQNYAGQLQQQEQDVCDSLTDMVDREQKLRDAVPELTDYQVFSPR